MSQGTVRRGRQKAEISHDSIFEIDLDELKPAEVNGAIYRPVDPGDPAIIELAQNIQGLGLKEPIVITLDNVILSGHRRRMACQVAGLEKVRCRRENIYSDDPCLERILVSYNSQRVKSIDEQVREQVVRANPEEEYAALIEHRRQQSRPPVATIQLRGIKKRAEITKAKYPLLNAINRVIKERKDFWPLSDRQIHYALLNDPPLTHASKPDSFYCNDKRSYNMVCELLTRARLHGIVPWEALADPTRTVQQWTTYREPGAFVQKQLDIFLSLNYYCRDLMQSQPNHIEIIGEKNTIDGVIRGVAHRYCISYTICRGYSSIDPIRQLAERFQASGKENLILLLLSDFDPEGEDIPQSIGKNLRDDFGLQNVILRKVALTAEQARKLQLPTVMKAKDGSSRYEGFVSTNGESVFELESIPPAQLQAMLVAEIDAAIDRDAFNLELEAEKQDAARLTNVRQVFHDKLKEVRL